MEGSQRSIGHRAVDFPDEPREFSGWNARVLRLAYLAPDITQAILEGRQPPGLTAEIEAELRRTAAVIENGTRHKIPMRRAVVEQLIGKAAQGDLRAINLLMRQAIEPECLPEQPSVDLSAELEHLTGEELAELYRRLIG